MLRRNTIEAVRSAINGWREDEEDRIERAERARQEALQVAEGFEQTVAALETQTCPFCRGTMVDTSPLKPIADKLQVDKHFLYQGEFFGLFCQTCQSYRTYPARESAERWTPDITPSRSKVFAAEIFQHFPQVEEVCLEKAVGRGWLFRIGDEWFANELTKDEIKEYWGL